MDDEEYTRFLDGPVNDQEKFLMRALWVSWLVMIGVGLFCLISVIR